MKETKVYVTSIKYKDNEKAKEHFINIILDYLLDSNLLKDGENESK